MSAYLSKLLSSKSYLTIRQAMKQIASHLPKPLEQAARRAEEYTRGMVTAARYSRIGFLLRRAIDGTASIIWCRSA